MNYGLEPTAKCVESDRRPSIMEGLQSEKKRVEQRLNDLNAAITAMESQPELTKTLELIQKVVRF